MNLATKCVNGVCMCILPLAQNDWRPLMLRHRALALVSTLLVSVKVLAVLAVAITPTTADVSTITVDRVVQLTNAERQAAGRLGLAVNPQLAAAAQRKAADILEHDYFAHISPSGITPWFWMQQQGYRYQVAGENLAIDFVEVEDVVAAWMNSPSHRDNMLHDAYTETGVAVATGEFQGGTSTVVVHMFGLPAGSPSSEAPQTAGTQKAVPSTVPTPTPIPVPAPDTNAPRAPEIALASGVGSVVANTLRVSVDAEAESTLTFLINNVPLTSGLSSTSVFELDISNIADGELVAAVYAEDAVGNTSELSNLLHIRKDATGPTLARGDASFIVGPTTDVPLVVARIAAAEAAQIRAGSSPDAPASPADQPLVVPLDAGELVFVALDELGNTSDTLAVVLQPTYAAEAASNVVAAPARLNRVSRWIIGSVGLLVLLLLAMAIFIRFSIQRPALIAHTSVVLLLAAVLLFI